MIIDRRRQWNENRGKPCGRHFGYRQRSRTTDHDVSPSVGRCYVVDEGRHIRSHHRVTIRRHGLIETSLTALMTHDDVKLGFQLGDSAWNQRIQTLRSLTATDHEDTNGGAAFCKSRSRNR